MGDRSAVRRCSASPCSRVVLRELGRFAPTYYTQTDAPLYYYSFTDAFIAMAYRSLTPQQQARLDPMITGFNPADMYAADHIKRVLRRSRAFSTGSGSSPSTRSSSRPRWPADGQPPDPALDRILDFAAEAGLVVLLHYDPDIPFPQPGQDLYMLQPARSCSLRHPKTTIIWAHCGLGRVVRPIKDSIERLEHRPGRSRPQARSVRHLLG